MAPKWPRSQLIKYASKRAVDKAMSFFKYCIVAGASASADWVVFMLLLFIGLPAQVSQPIARLAGGFVSFLFNRKWSFRSAKKSSFQDQGIKFLILYFFMLIFSYVLYVNLINFFELGLFIAKGAVDILCFCINFIVMRSWVYRKRNYF